MERQIEELSGKKARTRDRIMRALAREVLETGAHELSVQAVSDRAGVSHRTVYRYFPTKDDLFQSYGIWLDDVLQSRESMPSSLGEMAEAARETYIKFDEHPELVEAYVRIHASGKSLDVRRERSSGFLAMVHDETSALDDEHARALAAVLRQIVNSQTWVNAREVFGVEGKALQDVSAWVIHLISESIAEGSVPEPWRKPDEQRGERDDH